MHIIDLDRGALFAGVSIYASGARGWDCYMQSRLIIPAEGGRDPDMHDTSRGFALLVQVEVESHWPKALTEGVI